MIELSVKDLARKVLNISVNSVRGDLFSVIGLPGEPSLKSKLKLLYAVLRFAPEIRLHSEESNEPSSVSWFLERVRMRRDIFGPDEHILDRGDVTIETLISQSDGGEHSGDGSRQTQFFLEIHGDDKETTKQGDLASAECYVHFRRDPAHFSSFDIQYWFFYPYNGFSVGEHEGDWEHITVGVTPDFDHIRRIFFSTHAGGDWLNRPEVDFNETGHPIVYSAKGSHASYSETGAHHRTGLPDDHTDDGGPIWQTWKNLKAVGETFRPINGQLLVKYTGRWGEIGKFDIT